MNYSVQEMPNDQPAQGKVRFEQACFKCGSHYCLMDCVKEKPEPTPERQWVELTEDELSKIWTGTPAESEFWFEFAEAVIAKFKEKNK